MHAASTAPEFVTSSFPLNLQSVSLFSRGAFCALCARCAQSLYRTMPNLHSSAQYPQQ